MDKHTFAVAAKWIVRHQHSARIPANMYGKSIKIAPEVAFLSSLATSFVTGAKLPINGGYLAN